MTENAYRKEDWYKALPEVAKQVYDHGVESWNSDDTKSPNILTDYRISDSASGSPPKSLTNAADVLGGMASTYRERNAVYGSNYKMVAPLVNVLFPQGVPSELVSTHHWHLFELILVKLSRFAISDLNHIDSIHDAAVYGAMIEAILNEEQEN